MSDYIDETPLTDEEIAAAIAAAKKAKAERAKAQNGKQSKKTNKKQSKSVKKGNNSSESLFDQIDSTCEDEKSVSPKMESARSFSNAFAQAKSKREQSLSKKQVEEDDEVEEELEQIDVMPTDEVGEDEAVIFAADDETDEYEAQEFESDEEYDEDTTEYDIDEDEDDDAEVFTADDEGIEQVEFNGIFESDEDEALSVGKRVPVDEYDEEDYDDEEDDEEDDDDESAVSTKTKVIVGIIIAVLVLAVAAVGVFFALNSGDEDPADVSSVAIDPNAVKSIKFAEQSITVKVGESVPLNVIIEPETATDKTLMLKSGDMSIATVDGTGKVTGVASGSTTVTATLKSNDSISAVIIINVVDEKQNAINKYNSFINSILDGSTDIDSDADNADGEEDTDSENSSDSNSDSDSDNELSTPKEVLQGSIIRDLDSDGELELALYYTSAQDSNVRIFYLGTEGEDDQVSEPQYDEFGNLIEETDTESDREEDSDKNKERIILECDIYSDKYSQCYSSLEGENTSWDTVTLEVKEAETGKIKVTILSEDYKAPTYVYESSDESIVTVDNQGNVKGVKPGTCDVIVTSPLNSDAKAVVRVRVKDDTDLLEDYLAQIPVVNQTNDAVIPTETLIGKKIVDIDGDGMSELLLKFSYGHNVETINLVKVENEQCIVYKTYSNLSDLYDYYDGNGSYSNDVLVHYTTNKICMQYTAVVAKEGSKTKTSEQRIYTVDNNGSLGELVNFSTTTDITTKTVTSEVIVDNGTSNSTDSDDIDDTDDWFDNTDSDDENYSDIDWDSDDNNYVDEDGDGYDDITGVYFGTLSVGHRKEPQLSAAFLENPIPQVVGEPDDSGDDDNNDDRDEDTSRVTSTVTSEVTEETTKYFVNGTPVEKSVYEEPLSTYASRYTVWTDWDSV